MFPKILFVFITVPLIELAILIKLAGAIGILETVWIVVATAVAGAYLARRQGMSTLMSIRDDLNSGQMPSRSLIDGMMILIGAVALLTPGLLTDAAGFLLLIPVTRSPIKRFALRRIEKHMDRKYNIITIHPDE